LRNEREIGPNDGERRTPPRIATSTPWRLPMTAKPLLAEADIAQLHHLRARARAAAGPARRGR
jgi:hypothetical protein